MVSTSQPTLTNVWIEYMNDFGKLILSVCFLLILAYAMRELLLLDGSPKYIPFIP